MGALAILLPAAASIAINYLIGALLLIGGTAQFVQAWRAKDWSGFFCHALGAPLAILAGAFLVLFPLRGTILLTLVLAAFFVASGALRGWTAFTSSRDQKLGLDGGQCSSQRRRRRLDDLV